MAERFPNAKIVGYDFHEPSVEKARKVAAEKGLKNVTFEVGSAQTFPGTGYDLVTIFDALHDMGDPAGASAHVREALAPEGTFMIVEPHANDKLEDNLGLQGKILYAFSTQICVPASRAQEVGAMLGAQAGEARIKQVVTDGGFTRFRRAAETPFNLVFEARP
jgi:ubiquinone/menaquinone biosynthesis C-methylase UbiE